MSSRPSSKFLARATSVGHFTEYLCNRLTVTGQTFKNGGAAQSSSDNNDAAVRDFQAAVSDPHERALAQFHHMVRQFKKSVSSAHEPSGIVSDPIAWQLVICL
jgi:hypothetical protein